MSTLKPSASRTKSSKDRRSKIAGKLKTALDLMVFGDKDGKPLDFSDAARTANLTTRSMRRALERPNVRNYLREQKEVFRASASARNFHALVDVRDNSGNSMARVSAVKALEEADDNAPARLGRQPMPGLVFVINNGPPVRPGDPLDALAAAGVTIESYPIDAAPADSPEPLPAAARPSAKPADRFPANSFIPTRRLAPPDMAPAPRDPYRDDDERTEE